MVSAYRRERRGLSCLALGIGDGVRMPSRRGSQGWSALPKARLFPVISRDGGHMVVMLGGDGSGLCICGRVEMLGYVDGQREASEAGENGQTTRMGSMITKSRHSLKRARCFIITNTTNRIAMYYTPNDSSLNPTPARRETMRGMSGNHCHAITPSAVIA
jgi:hypothetical protein